MGFRFRFFEGEVHEEVEQTTLGMRWLTNLLLKKTGLGVRVCRVFRLLKIGT